MWYPGHLHQARYQLSKPDIRKAVLETKYFVLFSANSLGYIYNVVPPAISWFINHSKYRYIFHKP